MTDCPNYIPLILVVDDEEELVKLLCFNLEKEGYRVASAYDGYGAIDTALQLIPDLIILDIMLPGFDGLEVCRRIRSYEQTAAIPVLMLSARKEEIDKVVGLEVGADDYVAKPFGIREIIARVRALLRRQERKKNRFAHDDPLPAEKALQSGELTLYPEKYTLSIGNKECMLSNKEFEILHILMENRGRVLTREKLLEKIWGYDNFDVDTRTVDVHIRYLRQKIEKNPSDPVYIKTVRGVGYRFENSED